MQPETEEKILLARANDAMRLAEKRFSVKTLGFLNPHERILIQKNIKPPIGMEVIFDGGVPEAERTLMVCLPEYVEANQEEYITLLECTGRDIATLNHRDFLGSLMGLGITREKIGDILVGSEKTYLFIKPDIVEYVLENLTKIGRCGIRLKEVPVSQAELPEPDVKEIKTTVSALRLDAVVSAGTGVARGKAAELIQAGQVSMNWETAQSVSATVRENDVISVRGFGRMKLQSTTGTTRKGRIGVVIVRYV